MNNEHSGNVQGKTDPLSGREIRAVSPPVLCVMRIMGMTTRLAASAVNGVANCTLAVVQGMSRALAVPVKSIAAKVTVNRQVRCLNSEIAQLNEEVKQLHTEVGQKVCKLKQAVKDDIIKDPRLKNLLLAVLEKEQKVKLLETRKLHLASGPAQKDQPEAKQNGIVAEKSDQKTLTAEVRALVQQSPEGVSLSEMGKRLNIAWQRLVPAVRALVKSEVIRKEGSKYYLV